MSEPDQALRRIALRFDGVCCVCGISLSPRAVAMWDRVAKKVTCLACAVDGGEPEPGVAGASAAAEGIRRRDNRIEDVRRKYGDHAAAVAREMAERDSAATWGKGSRGESRLAAFVEREVGDAVIPLHDRLIPGTRGNIDHIFVAASGVWVVDAKALKGNVVQREVGSIWRRENQVFVGGRNRTSLAKGVEKQVAAVLAALKPDPELKGIDVNAALCFLDAGWGLFDLPFQVGYVWVMYPGALRKRLKKKGSLSRQTMERIARRLDLSLPSAA